MTDYPDWQTYPTAQGTNLFPAYSQVLAPGAHSTGVIATSSWSSVTVIVHPSAGAAQVQVIHHAAPDGSQPVDSSTWPVNSNTKLIARTPLRALYVEIIITVTSAGNLTAVTWATPQAASSDRISFPVGQVNVSAFALAVPASTTDTASVGAIVAGQALMYVKPYDNSGHLAVVIHAVSELGVTGQLIADFGAPTALVQQLITVPDLITTVSITNTDATAPHTCDFSLTIPPQ